MIRTYRYLDEIKNPLDVTSLNLSCQHLRSIPSKVFDMHNLIRLDVERNGISHIPAEIGQLENLISLNASYNRITSLPFTFLFLRRLNVLSLAGNDIQCLTKEFLLPALEILNLAHNPLYEYCDEIGQLNVHSLLELSSIKSKEIPPLTGCYSRLRRFVFHFKKKVAFPEWIYNLKKLEQLELDHSQLHSISPEIGKLKNLKTLTLTDNNLTQLPDEIGDCNSLETLLLSHNILNSLPKSLINLKNLKLLDIKDNAFERFPSLFIQRPDLKWNLKDNPLLQELGVN
jgi:Leucine-rich repeat (LRR) protein